MGWSVSATSHELPSVPSELAFYEQLDGVLSATDAVEVAKTLRDASYLIRVMEDEKARALAESEGFRKSLQRERASIKAFLDGWKIFERRSVDVMNLGFRFKDVLNAHSTLNLKFQSSDLLPHDVNVLIGPNGAGKSRVLHQIVEDWIHPADVSGVGFTSKPNLSQIVIVSYSPFERFPVEAPSKESQDGNFYRYFGFRGRSRPSPVNKKPQIRLSHEFPKRDAAWSIVECVAADKRFRAVPSLAQKVKTVERVLSTAFDFDCVAVCTDPKAKPERFYSGTKLPDSLIPSQQFGDQKVQYVPVLSDWVSWIDETYLRKHLLPAEGVVFFKDRRRVELSSGQRLFAYIVINILGAIRRNSLILIDEPELFLHPTLEIQFVDMLKKILSEYNSKALLATHSVVTVRETPADCVHVFERTADGVIIKHPPFQTFGGDTQRISSYVFGDHAVSKPFERWINEAIDDLGSGDALLEKLGNSLNEELIVQIKAVGRAKW